MSEENNPGDFPEENYKYDISNFKNYFKGYAEDLRTSYNRSFREVVERINLNKRIIVVGSSWSLNAVKILADYLKEKVCILFGESYDETIKLTQEDLVIVLTYSGYSEEASAWMKHARRADSQILILTAGSKILEDATNNITIDLTKNLPSKCSTFTIIGSLLKLFEDAGLIESRLDEVQETVDFLRTQDFSDLGKSLSKKLHGLIPLVYSSVNLKSAAYRFKMLLNSNAKTTAFFNVIPGAENYDAEGFTNKNALYHAILLSSSEDLSRIKKKILVFKEVIQKQGVGVTEINIKGRGLCNVAKAVLIGEYTSYYLALRYKQDPLSEVVTKKIIKDMGIYI